MIKTDWHIHSRNSCDGASLNIPDLVKEAQLKGIFHYGISDHFHTIYNIPDIRRSRDDFLAFSQHPVFHFGIEVSCMSKWELDIIRKGEIKNPVYGIRSGGPAGAELCLGGFNKAIKDFFKIEYVIGGTHWPMYVPFKREEIIKEYHRQNMFLATHPLIDIVAHPWWWMGHWADQQGKFTAEPWFDDFSVIPSSMHKEFASAVRENKKAVEINAYAIFLNGKYPEHFKKQYAEYLAFLQSEGVLFSIGSDCHKPHYDPDFATVQKFLEEAGVKIETVWNPFLKN